MIDFRLAIKTEFEKAFAEVWKEWDIIPSDDETFVVRSNKFLINFFYDSRVGLIESNLVCFEAAKEHQNKLQLHIIIRMFSRVAWQPSIETRPVQYKLQAEVNNMREIICMIKKGETLPRDLFHFQEGYNRAYTDYMSD
jgi:hypothetical protein